MNGIEAGNVDRLSPCAALAVAVVPGISHALWPLLRLTSLAMFYGAVSLVVRMLGAARRRAGGEGPGRRLWFERVFASMGDAVIATDAAGRVVFMNAAAESLTGWSGREARRRPLGEVFRLVEGETRRPIVGPFEACLRGEGHPAGAGEMFLIARDESEAPVEGGVAPIRAGKGRISGVVGVFRSGTRRDRADPASWSTHGTSVGTIHRRAAGLARANAALAAEVGLRVRAEKALREANQVLLALVRSSPLAIITLDPCHRVTMWNASAERLFGWTEGEVAGYGLPNIPDDPGVEFGSGFGEGSRESGLAGFETRRRRKDGTLADIEIWTAPVFDDEGKYVARLGIVADIAGRKRAEEERERLLGQLEAERARLETVLQQLPSGVAIFEAPSGRLLLCNDEAGRLLGRPLGDVLGPDGLLGTDGLPFHAATRADGTPSDLDGYPVVRSMRSGEVVQSAVVEYRRADAGPIYLSVNSAPIHDPQGVIVAAVGVFQDITERRRGEQERSMLLRRLVTSQEEERHRLARELHDQMGQHLTALTLGLRALRDDGDPAGRDRRLGRLHELVDRMGREAHQIALELRPTALDDLGLHSAVSNHVEEWSERYGIEVDFESRGLDYRRLDPELETALYRIVQEALTNVARHAGATRVGLVLEHGHGHLLAIIEDDGVGFDPDPPSGGGRIGLVGMKERATLVGGTIQVESHPGQGTTVLVRVPLDRPHGAFDDGESVGNRDDLRGK